MNILNVAWKFDRDSAFSHEVSENSDKNYFFAFKVTDDSKRAQQVLSFAGFLVGVVVYVLNKWRTFREPGNSDVLRTRVKRNYASEMVINQIIKRYKIGVVNVHWCGYGFLPTDSLDYIKNIHQLNVFHHDWYHFTSGEHVPIVREGFTVADYLKVNSGLFGPLIQNIFVSSYQEQQVKSLRLPNRRVRENKLRESFVLASRHISPSDIYAHRILHSEQIFIVFIGVKEGNCDNKGVASARYILDGVKGADIFSIGVGCDDSLEFSLSFTGLEAAGVYHLLSASDLTIITSRLETFSMVALESQFCKTPVVFRRTLAPGSFSDPRYLFASKDDSDKSLLSKVIECKQAKRRIALS